MILTQYDHIDITPPNRASRLDITGYSSQHSIRYQQSVSDPHGVAPDYTRCAAVVWKKDKRSHKQCRKGRGHGPEQAFCRAHERERA